MFAKIMVPLDGSDLAERAMPVAERLARATGASLLLVRVSEPVASPLPLSASIATGRPVPLVATPVAHPLDTETQEARTQAALDYLIPLRERLVRATGGAVRVDALTGDSAAMLLEYERVMDGDLVVMCSHGRGGVARFALGSIADRLVRHGSAPVLLVRAFGAPARLDQAMVPLDGSPRAEPALPVVAGLAGVLVQEAMLLQVIHEAGQGPPAEHYLAETARRLGSEKLICRYQVTLGHAAERILEEAAPDKLVVMGTHGRGGLRRWLLGSVADHVTHGGAAAVLLVRTAAQRASSP